MDERRPSGLSGIEGHISSSAGDQISQVKPPSGDPTARISGLPVEPTMIRWL